MERLDPLSIASCLSSLSAHDLAKASTTCTTLASVCRINALWLPLLEEHDLYLKGTQGCQSLDLQSTYRQLTTAPDSHALRFAAVATDGGCDGMATGDLTYWADHAFQPNHWSPHCSDGRSDIHITALLQLPGAAVDVSLAARRAYLVARCAPAAAVLFSPHGQQPGAGAGSGDAAARLAGWSSVGLERLFMDLYQDLVQQQQASTWGRLLLQDVPRPDIPAELARLNAAAAAISRSERGGLYSHVTQVPAEEVEAAAAAAAAAAAMDDRPAGSRQQQQEAKKQQQQGAGQEGSAAAEAAGSGGEAPALPAWAGATAAGAAAAAPNARSPQQEKQQQWLQHLQQQQQQQQQQRQQQLTPQQAARHLVDAGLLGWFDSPSCTQTTALVRELVVSRAGHVTCPVQSGAVFLGQQPTAATADGDGAVPAAAAAAGDVSLAAAAAAVDLPPPSPPQQQQQQRPAPQLSSATQPGLRQVLLLKHDPLVAVLSGATTAAQVLAAVGAGLLPPVLRHHQLAGAEWLEFAPLGRQQRLARAAAGWHLRPVVWFRFHTAAEVAEVAVAEAAAAAAAAAADAAEAASSNQQQQHDPPQAAAAAGSMDADGGAAAAAAAAAGAAAAAAPADGSDIAMLVGGGLEAEDDSDSVHGGGCAATGVAAGCGATLAGDNDGNDEDMSHDELADVMGSGSSRRDDGDCVMAEAAAAGHHHQQQQQQEQQQQPGRPPWRAAAGASSGLELAPPPAGLCEAAHVPGAPNLVLRMGLSRPRCGNLLLLKLISCEDRMGEFNDPSEEPNIDVQYVAVRGVGLRLTERQMQLL